MSVRETLQALGRKNDPMPGSVAALVSMDRTGHFHDRRIDQEVSSLPAAELGYRSTGRPWPLSFLTGFPGSLSRLTSLEALFPSGLDLFAYPYPNGILHPQLDLV